jgi:phosphoribosylanthranilate isomerase
MVQMRPKVKICGLTRIEDARLALSLGADELGFVLAPSPRRIAPEALKSLLEGLRGEGGAASFRAIGVFVNEEASAMRDIIAYAGLDAAQIHGDETRAACEAFGFPWYRALRIASVDEAERRFASDWPCPRLLADASTPSGYGGTGVSIGSWAALAAKAFARERGKEFFVAGGIKPRNVASFLHSLSPDGIDVSSGVEESPGRKSPEKLGALFREISIAAAAARAEGKPHAAR